MVKKNLTSRSAVKSEPSANKPPAKQVIRAKKPRPWRRFFWILGGFIILLLVVGGGRVFFMLNKVTGSSLGGNGLLSLPLASSQKLNGQDEGRINVLLIGIGGKTHPKGGNLADSIILASFKLGEDKNEVALMSLPRDLRVKMPAPFRGYEKINAVHSYGEQYAKKTGGGPLLLKKVVEDITGQSVHYWVRVDFVGFQKLVDAVGGITIDVPKDLVDPYFPAPDLVHYAPFSIRAGRHHLDGKTALKYARSRYTTSDFDRSKRQQQVIQAVKQEFQEKGYFYRPDKLLEILSILSQHLRTDMTSYEIKQFYRLLKNTPIGNIKTIVLDNSASGPLKTYSNGGYYLVTKTGDWSQIRAISQHIFDEQNANESSSSQKNL